MLDALGLTNDVLAERETPGSSPATKRDADSWPDPSALPTAEELQRWHSRLLKRSERLAYLTSERGLTKDVIRDNWIGWSGRAYTLPVYADDWGNLVNVRRYVPDQGMRNRKGCGSPPRLYPEPPSPGHRHVVVTEGEWDALVARSHGIEAYSGTGGAHKWPPGASAHFAGMTVYVIYDCDESGRSGALKVARDLHPHAHAVRIVDLGLDDREDLTDWFVKYGRSKADLWSLLRDADQYEPQGEEKEADESGEVDPEEVARALGRLRVQDRARTALREEQAAAAWELPPSRRTLVDELAIPDPPMEWTVVDLHPTGGNTLLSARYKAGKTTLLLNLFSALLDGELFLGSYPTAQADGRVAFWNYELSDRQFRDWLRAFDLSPEAQERAAVWNLRGHTLPLSTDHVADQAVRWLAEREVSALIIDPFARAFDGDNENDNTQVGRFLERVDVIKRRAGVADLFLASHFGRGQESSAERSRGATRLDDWADSRWTYVIDDHDKRFLSANGRDVEVPESEVLHDPATRRLQWIGGSRREAKQEEHVRVVVETVVAQPGVKKGTLRAAVSGDTNQKAERIAEAIRRGYVRVEDGPGGSQLHYPTDDGEQFASRVLKVQL